VSNDNEHGKPEFTQAQAQAMYALLRKQELIFEEYSNDGSAQDVANKALKLALEARTLLSALATPASTPPASGNAAATRARYSVRHTIHGIPYIWDSAINGLADIVFTAHDDAKLAIVCEFMNAQESGKP